MKKFLVLFSIISVISLGDSKAQKTTFMAEEQNAISLNSINPTAFVWASHYYKNSNWGTFAFALVAPAWGELLVGPNYTFVLDSASILEVGAGIGMEIDPLPVRGMAYLFYQYDPNKAWRGRVQSLLDAEYGSTGYWYLGYVTYNPTQHFGFGAHAQFGTVAGLRLQTTPIPQFLAYGVGGWNIEGGQPGFLVGLRGYF
jgi:hypothetical protein